MLDFDEVQAALEGLGANVDAAEAHGTLCALLLENADLPVWLGHTLDDLPDASDVLAKSGSAYSRKCSPKRSSNSKVKILSWKFCCRMRTMISACACWPVELVPGFLYGFGVKGATAEDALDDDAREGLSDLLEISKLSHDEEASEAAQQQFAEIVEHVRIVTLMLKESMNPLKSAPTVH